MLAEATRTNAPEGVSLTDVVFPDRANHYGTLFGGNALSLMGKAAFLAATRYTRCHVVMASSDKITFAEPVRVGDLIDCVASVSRVGRSSMTVTVQLFHEGSLGGARRLAVFGSFEMVAVNADGRPTCISGSHQQTDVREEAVREIS